MTEIPIARVEEALNFWRDQAPRQGAVLVASEEMNALSELYGLMIHDKSPSVEWDALTPLQQSALLQPTSKVTI